MGKTCCPNTKMDWRTFEVIYTYRYTHTHTHSLSLSPSLLLPSLHHIHTHSLSNSQTRSLNNSHTHLHSRTHARFIHIDVHIKISGTIILMLAFGLGAIVFCREYLGTFLNWLSHLSGWQGPVLFCALFTIVSFPMMWGYIILNLGAGYIYGMVMGSMVTAVGANIGALVSFIICRRLWKDYVLQKLSAYENLKQIVRVIEGRQGFRIIMMTRLTPVPFGLQNALFSVRSEKGLRWWDRWRLSCFFSYVLYTFMYA